MDLMHPFKKREPTQEELIKSERQFTREQSMMAGTLPDNAEDERVWLETGKERADLIKWQQNLEPELRAFVYDIKGYIKIGESDWQESQSEKITPLANDRFVKKAMAIARPLLSKNLIMSNYTEDRILRNLTRVTRTLRIDLLQNRVTYEIKKTNMEYIVGLFKEVVEAAYFRSLNNGERRHLSTIGKRIELFSDKPIPKKSLFGTGGA